MENTKIAVVGLGPAGLSALKSLCEEGFDAIGFERRSELGGLWSFSDDLTYTSVLNETVCNVSKFVVDYPPYPTSGQVADYFNSYARHFNLLERIRFRTTVNRVTRSASGNTWDVHITSPDGDAVYSFDKVVFGHGCESTPTWPPMPNKDKFKGILMHSQAFKSPEPFRGKRVLVVGIGNTACDVSLVLRRHATKVYQAYRRGRILVSRYLDNGIPMDTQLPWPLMRLKYFLDDKFPWLMTRLADKMLMSKMISDAARSEPAAPGLPGSETLKQAERRVRDDWRLLPAPSMAHTHPAVQEDFIPALREGDIVPLQGFKDFAGEYQVLLQDDTIVEVDAVIFCTGYDLDFTIMPEMDMDGAAGMPLACQQELMDRDNVTKVDQDDRRKPHLPRLFQMIFPPRWASSIAFLSWMAPQENVWCVCELASMAVAQIWAAEAAGSVAERSRGLLPSAEEMNAQVDAYHAWWRGEWEQDQSMRSGYVRAYSFYRSLHDAAGTGLYDQLDHMLSGRGWGLWWRDRELWTWLAKGPMNSYSWRLFETNPKGVPGRGRRTWAGARKALREAYEDYEDFRHRAEARHKQSEG
ncbi:FAD/NAD(P)-binding domain-containing protein [Hypoxylon sp. FL1284]|nr:FAD/NAD(P)-binding domain-containing protein [Hypoxylon sp. FL1284]